MASLARNVLAVALMLLPVVIRAYRPFHIPKTLFTPGLKDASLPEGVREINAQTSNEHEFNADDLWSDESDLPSHRSRRAASSSPPLYVESDLPEENHEVLFKSWPRDTIILLAKNKVGVKTSNVYISVNSGRNWTNINSKLLKSDGSFAVVDQIYVSKVNQKLCILADIINQLLFITTDYKTFSRRVLRWKPSFLTFHPISQNRIMGYDKAQKKLYLSVNGGSSFLMLSDRVRAFWWGAKDTDPESTIFVDQLKSGSNPKSAAIQFSDFTKTKTWLDNIDEFEVMKNYMFATQTLPGGKTKLVVSYNRKPFVDTQFPVTESNRDYFVFDVLDDQVFVVINHRKNESNMYLSNIGGTKFTLSLPRVLYHNPYTDVSSPWLRTVVPYAFVDVHKVKSMRGVYVATQLTPGPVGRRHLLSLITYNKGGSWGRIRSPTRDVNSQPIYCYLPACSLHFNLLYGSVYRISPSENLLSSTSAPGLVMALGVASTNLKIHPDMFLSTDGGLNWKRVLRGKHQYAFGDHGGVVVATFFRRYTQLLKYSVDGGESWQTTRFSPTNLLVQDIVTQDDEKLPIFLVYGTPSGKKKSWKIYQFNMTNVLGAPCQSEDYMKWIPSDDRVGYDKCSLGRQEEYQIRNWSRPCYLGRDYQKAKLIKNCPCTRADFECDFGFERNASHPNCHPVPGEDLNNDLIPKDCKEGSTYNRSSGYRKIPGDTCVGGEESNFLPVDTPCPVKDLSGLVVATSPSKKPLGVAPNITVTFTASFTKTAYLPNINFRWDFGDGTSSTGTGSSAAVATHKYKKSGHYVLVLTATNTRSILTARVEVYVEETFQPSHVDVTYSPADPTVVQPITFLANLIGLTRDSAGHLTYEWFIDGKSFQKGFQGIFIQSFNKSKSYNVVAKVSNMVGSVQKSISVSVSKDIRPKGMKAKALGPTSVLVSWEPPLESSLYIAGFKVFKSTLRNSGFTEAGAVPRSQFSRIVTGLIPSTTYNFKVMAFTTVGDGPFSDIVSATTNASAPGKPKNLRGYALSSTTIRIEWGAPDDDFGRVTNYRIRWWSEPEVQNKMIKVVGGSVRKSEFDKLKQDTVYNFEMVSVSALGNSAPAGPVAVRSNISKPAYPPRNFRQLTNNGTCAFLTWDAAYLSADKQRLFPAQGYKLYVNDQLRATTSEKSAVLCSFAPGRSYNVKVSAYSVMGEGPKASLSVTVNALKPTPPRSLTATAKTSRIIKLRWEVPSATNGELLNYAVYQTSPASWSKPISVPPSKTSYDVTGLEPYTKYEFVVVANNIAGLSDLSNKASAMTHEELPDPPQYVKTDLVSPDSNTIRLSWSEPKNPNGKITGYMISWGKTSVTDGGYNVNKQQEVVGNVLTYTFEHLYSNTEYSFAVASKNGAGRSSSYSEPTKQYTQPAPAGTKRLEIKFQGPKDTAADSFESDFIVTVRSRTNIPSERIAALNIKAIAVEFEILPNFKANGKSVDQVITILNSSSFSVGSGKTVAGSVRVLRIYGKPTVAPSGKPGVVGKRVGSPESSKSQNLALIIVLAIVGLLLLAVLVFGVVFYYRKYKSLEKHYSHMSSSIYRARDDELSVIYPGEMADERNDRKLDMKSKSKTKTSKEEHMPLGEHDELALV